MVNPEVIRKKIGALEGYLGILQKISQTDQSQFVANPEKYGSAERFLQLSIECLKPFSLSRSRRL